jgi:HD-GYP domain-containing protein (c-di-GMP phosphodiesterase class II)
VAENFVGLTSNRVYRPSWTEAVAGLQRAAGSQLDPACVAAFVCWLARTGELEQPHVIAA